MIFDINFDKWIASMLPTFMRHQRIFAFCRALCSPLYLGEGGLYPRFLQTRSDHIYRLSHNGQVCYLRAALNDAFGLKKGFDIEDVDDYEGEWVYAKDQTMPQQLLAVDEAKNPKRKDGDPLPEHPTPLLADEARLNAPHNAFVVRVPGDIYATQLDKVKAIVEQYRILSKTPIYSPTKNNNEQSGISLNGGRKWWQWPVSVIDPGSLIYTRPDQLFTSVRTDWREILPAAQTNGTMRRNNSN